MASRLLNHTQLLVVGRPHRLVEIEFYYRDDQFHDPFIHADTRQVASGRWYFHRAHGRYRGGSYKGLDMTFGDGQAFGGILIRTIEDADGRLINGPSLCVDYLLRSLRKNTVAEVDALIGPSVWNPRSRVHLRDLDVNEARPITRSLRVGLSLKRLPATPQHVSCLLQPDRFLTEPRRIRKGKVHLALTRLAEGCELEEVQQLTGTPRSSLLRYVREMAAGEQMDDLSLFDRAAMSTQLLCRLQGAWKRFTLKSVNG